MRSIWPYKEPGKRTATVPVKCRRKCKWQEKPGVSPVAGTGKTCMVPMSMAYLMPPGICETIATALAARKGITLEMAGQMDYIAYKEEQYDKLAEILRESLDMEKIYEIMGLEEKVHIEQVLPADIEHRSFEIIGEELKAMGKELEPEQAPVIMRAIHTTADFDYADHLKFSENAVEKAREAIKKGAVIITDTKMGWSGVNKKRLESYGGEALCFMADEDVAAEAKKNGSTRAVASMDKAANLFGDGTRPCIFAIGNDPNGPDPPV